MVVEAVLGDGAVPTHSAGRRLPWERQEEPPGARLLEDKARSDPGARAARERAEAAVRDDWTRRQDRMEKAVQHRQGTAMRRVGVDRAADVAARHAANVSREERKTRERIADREERHAASASRLGVARALADARRDERRQLREESLTMTLARRAEAEAAVEHLALGLEKWLAKTPMQRARAQYCSRTELQLHQYVKRREAGARQDAAYARRVELLHCERERVQNKLVAREGRRRDEAERARRADEAEAEARVERAWQQSLQQSLQRNVERSAINREASRGRREPNGGAAATNLAGGSPTPAAHMATHGAVVSLQAVRSTIAYAGEERRARAQEREEARRALLDASRQKSASGNISLRRRHALDKRRLAVCEANLAAVNAASFAAADAAAAAVFELDQKLERTQEQLEQARGPQSTWGADGGSSSGSGARQPSARHAATPCRVATFAPQCTPTRANDPPGATGGERVEAARGGGRGAATE